MKRIEDDAGCPGPVLLEPRVFGDARGFFFESYRADRFAELGIGSVFVQDNHSSSETGVLRGLHYQIRQPQAKLVRVARGTVFDVVVDIRRGSPAFGRWRGVTLSAENKRLFFVPEGFAHGIYVVEGPVELLYKCSDYYAPEYERGVAWNDPDLAIPWPLAAGAPPILSDKDARYPALADIRPEDLPVRGNDIEDSTYRR